jgi:hypothetical protein
VQQVFRLQTFPAILAGNRLRGLVLVHTNNTSLARLNAPELSGELVAAPIDRLEPENRRAYGISLNVRFSRGRTIKRSVTDKAQRHGDVIWEPNFLQP